MAARDPDATVPLPGDVATVDVLGASERARRGDRKEVAEAESVPTPITIGRYQLLGLVGKGGMGMVFGAWDPELERRVALKLVRLSSESSRLRMLREAQMLAKLSHPNVVPVYDVGEVGNQVYLVMEYVRGTTLGAFAESSPGRASILDAYQQAGAGLAAAHRAGVVHRDFKPANAIRGDDDRVRVLDFGIAHTGHDDSAPGVGTPAYMAPEQRVSDAPLTAAVDQFAFCVSLREALGANGGVPAWIAEVLDRGTQSDPARRFPSFDELLTVLAHDPARRRKRLAVGAGVIVAAAAAFAIGQRSSGSAEVELCVGGPAEIARSWRPTTRTAMIAHARTLGPRAVVEAERLARELDGDAVVWSAEHRGACLAHERKELSPARYDARLGCLARTRAHLAAVADLMTTIDAAGLDDALFAARMRPDSRGCADVDDAIAPPPAAAAARIAEVVPKIERTLVLAAAWRADPSAAATAAEAREVGYTPLVARALLAQGRALIVDALPSAAPVLEEAVRLALQASDDTLAVEAYARWLWARAAMAAPAFDNFGVIEILGDRLGTRGRFVRGLLHNSLGVARLVGNDREAARTAFERALATSEGAPEIELAFIGQNLANLEPTIDASVRRMQATYERFDAVLGPTHPQTIVARTIVGLMTPDRARARAAYGDCSGLDGRFRSDCLYEAAWLADDAGDVAAATQLMARHPGGDDAHASIARAFVALRREGALSAAHRRALETIGDATRGSIFERADAADALVLLALASTGADAEDLWRRANALLASIEVAVVRRQLARTNAELAQRWASTHPLDAAIHAQRALAWYRASPSDTALVARLEALTERGSR